MSAITTTTTESRIYEAAVEYIGRRDRTRHPAGRTDNAGRWFPSPDEDPNGTIAHTTRSPSRAWPWSYAHACRSAAHVAEIFGVSAAEVRREARRIDARAKAA